MFRTRDFILIFSIAFFLVVAIGVTSLKQFLDNPVSSVRELKPSEFVIEEYSAVAGTNELSRDEAIESLRKKLAREDSVIKMPAPAVVPEKESENEEEADEDTSVQLCSVNSTFGISPWVPQDTYWQVDAGTRVLYESPYVEVTKATTSSSSVMVTDIARVRLAMPFLPNSTKSCLSMDVIGIALDGSLIRNNEAGLYRVFTSDSLVGYALDGFPIHGLGKDKTDECGGRVVSGQYRYELSNERDVIINCFGGMPQTLAPGNTSI